MHDAIKRFAMSSALGVGALFSQSVAADSSQREAFYVQQCLTQMVALPVPLGDADLKDNPKLDAYCRCFAAKFEERLELRQQHPGPAPPLKQSLSEERAMRNGCRQSLGLPLLVFPAPP